MSERRLFPCGGLRGAEAPRGWRTAARLPLEIGAGRDVHLRVDQLTSRMKAGVPDVALDLLEVASFVFAADQAVPRGGTSEFDYGSAWRRRFRFEIPVRCPEVWSRPEVRDALAAALRFLTDDEYEFGFHPAVDPVRADGYLFDTVAPDGKEFAEVVLFSGGLDSLCGAVEEALVARRRVVLVSHRSSTRVTARQQALFEAIRRRAGRSRAVPHHVGVTVNKGEELNRDFNQRSRSFVYAAIAAVVARQVGLRRVRFYENGVTSLNLPVSPEQVGARASRTTHPQSLARFGRLLSLLFETDFEVENPFQRSTKAEILGRLRGLGHADLCAMTCSCGRVWGVEERTPHCGHCSQCVERRLSILGAGLTDAEDLPCRYQTDPLTGERDGPELTYAERYVGMAREVEQIGSAREFAVRYPEVNEALPYLGMPTGQAAELIYGLYHRHAAGVSDAIQRAFCLRPEALYWQKIPARSLLGMTLGRSAPAQPDPGCDPDRTRDRGLVVDRDRFEVRFDGRVLVRGNTLEFRFMERMSRSRGVYLPIVQLGVDVWGDAGVSKNSVQRVVCSIRRCLRTAEVEGVNIDGAQAGYYRLILPPS